ncbi:MAG: hypothetical protein V8T45_05460 [Oscillospiraceae bacterium]
MKGLHTPAGKAAACGQDAHANTGDGVPAQTYRQGYHYGHQGYDLLKGADKGAHGHKEQNHHSHKPVAGLAEAAHHPLKHVEHQPAAVQAVEDSAYNQQEGDDGDDGAAALLAQYQ